MDKNISPEILEKVAKLRGMAEQAVSPEEAGIAAGKLSNLLVRNGLSIMDLDLHAKKSQRKVVKAEVLLYSYRYLHLLYGHVAAAFNCRAIVLPQHKKNYSFMALIGHDHNIVVVQDMAQWLTTVCDSMANKGWKDLGKMERIKFSESSWKRAFKLGFVDAVGRALKGTTEEIAADETLKALVVVVDQEVQAKVDEEIGEVRDLPKTPPVLTDGYQKGRKAGESVNVKDRQLGGEAEAPLAIE